MAVVFRPATCVFMCDPFLFFGPCKDTFCDAVLSTAYKFNEGTHLAEVGEKLAMISLAFRDASDVIGSRRTSSLW
jgi:hypothetical protein